MKIRTKFVSNSSSSSFVVIGYEIEPLENSEYIRKLTGKKLEEDDAYEEKYNLVVEQEIVLLTDGEGAPNGKNIVGVGQTWGQEDFPAKVFSFEEVKNKLEDIRQKLQLSEDIEIKIFAGTTFN